MVVEGDDEDNEGNHDDGLRVGPHDASVPTWMNLPMNGEVKMARRFLRLGGVWAVVLAMVLTTIGNSPATAADEHRGTATLPDGFYAGSMVGGIGVPAYPFEFILKNENGKIAVTPRTGEVRVASVSVAGEVVTVVVRFRGTDVPLEGRLTDGEVRGKGTYSGVTFPWSVRRVSGVPNPAAPRAERWRTDLDHFRTEFPKRHVAPFHKTGRKEFEASVERLKQRVNDLPDWAVVAELQRIVASVGDGHTSLGADAMYRRLPLFFSEIGGEVLVVAAAEPYLDLIGTRVTRIGTATTPEALRRLAPFLVHENAASLSDRFGGGLRTPELLMAAGIVDSSDPHLEVVGPDGKSLTVVVKSLTAGDAQKRAYVTVYKHFNITPPLRQEQETRFYWFKHLPEAKAIYVNYRACRDMPDVPFREFTRQLFAVADEHPDARLIVDLRANQGGSSSVILPLIQALTDRPRFRAPGSVTALIGRTTFSSGYLAAVDLKRRAGATLIGGPTGQRPNHYGEVRTFTLPYSELPVFYSTKFLKTAAGDEESLMPDIPVALRADAFLAGRDLVLERALAQPVPARP